MRSFAGSTAFSLPPDTTELRERYTAWCREHLFTPDVVRATGILNRICDLHLLGVHRRLELTRRLANPKTVGELTAELGFVESASITLENALRRLADRTGTIALEGDRFRAARQPYDPEPELAELRAEMRKLGESYLAAVEFLDFGAERFVEALSTDPDFMDRLLSGRDDRFAELWHRATNVDPLQDLHGEMGAQAILEILADQGTILEIGGGTGNGIRHLFAMAKRRGCLERIGKFIFTDISMRFVLSTKHEINAGYPEVRTEWKFCDLNRSLAAQKIAPESLDLVYAVNAAHVAKDLVGFLASCREALRPGGAVLFAERVRMRPYEMAPRELTLNLSIYHRTAAEKASFRPMHCYLSPAGWEEALSRANLEPLLLPDLEQLATVFPDQYAAVIVGFKR
jgi:SAM-dependent methyltransferase